VDDAHGPTWVPDDAGENLLRIPGPNQLGQLEAAYKAHRGHKPRVLPYLPQRYRTVADHHDERAREFSSGYFSERWVVFQRAQGDGLPIERAVDVASALKEALAEAFRARGEDVPEMVSGLSRDGRPLQRPHVAFVALPFVDHTHADGHLMGVAAIVPRSLQGAERRNVFAGLGHVETLKPAAGLLWSLRRLTPAITRPFSLDPARWCRSRSLWATVTPVLLDRFPGDMGSSRPETAARAEAEAKQTIAVACERIGLPAPRAVELVALPPFRGVPPATRFRCPVAKPGRPKRLAVHVILDFGAPVRGPVLIGAGRYLGLGLCLPVPEGRQ